MPRCRREWEGYSERAGEGESGVQLCSIVVFAVWLALLLFLPDLRLRFRRSPLFLPVSWLSSPRKEIVRYGLGEKRERERESCGFGFAFGFSLEYNLLLRRRESLRADSPSSNPLLYLCSRSRRLLIRRSC